MTTINTHTHSPEVFVATYQLNYAMHRLENLQLPSEETPLNCQ